MKARTPRTTAQEIQGRFLRILIGMTLLMGLGVVGTVGYRLVKQQEAASTHVIASLKRSMVDKEPDWQAWEWHLWRRNSSIDTRQTFVMASRGGQHQHRYYSPNTKAFLRAKHYGVPFFEGLDYTPGYGLTFYRSGSRSHVVFETWLRLKPITDLLWSVLGVVVLVALVILMLGWIYVRLTADQLTRPLVSLSSAARRQAQANRTKVALPVPARPLEAHQLARSFNDLLAALNQHAQQEREFTANAAHELRTPIAAIRGHVQLVKRRGAAHPEIVPRSLGFIDQESAKMQDLVNSLLMLSRADRGMLKLTTVDLGAIIQETLEEKRVTLAQPLVYQGPATVQVWGHPASVQQMLSALLDNAGKYSPADQPITVTLAATAQGCRLTVADLGRGIADADKAHIFERFYRVSDAQNRQVTGTGLGLAIVAQLAHLNHVTIAVHDNQPAGSRFVLDFQRPQSENLSD
ncbi:sensor histidine kinase [Levilactobacillus spicheri]|nr:HAMP domain-containing sensor histidine kinase [Levilactobacillus spicheri]